jgi:hypothetical protein
VNRVTDTSNCPVAGRCTRCPRRDDLTVVPLRTVAGVFCATLCALCVEAGRLPWPESVTRTADMVLDHCEHTGLSVDDAAALLDGAPSTGEGVDR